MEKIWLLMIGNKLSAEGLLGTVLSLQCFRDQIIHLIIKYVCITYIYNIYAYIHTLLF